MQQELSSKFRTEEVKSFEKICCEHINPVGNHLGTPAWLPKSEMCFPVFRTDAKKSSLFWRVGIKAIKQDFVREGEDILQFWIKKTSSYSFLSFVLL